MAMFPSRLEAWKTARSFIEDFCRGAEVPRESCLKTNLVIEELFLNTVKHGHRGGSDAPVWITLTADGGKVSLAYEDSAPPFNPFARLPAKEVQHKIGGLGVLLTRELAAGRDYAYLFGRNRVRLSLAR
jgi:anti-sigma regulatory factor (Ser/Thr protein kinase)